MLRSITLAAPLFLTAAIVSHSIGDDILTPGQPLADDGRTLIFVGDRFALGFFSPVEYSQNRYVGIWYHGIADGKTVVWVANRQRPTVGRFGSLSLASNDTLVITDGNLTVIWSSSSPAVANPVAQLLDDGNFIVKEGGSGRSSSTSAAGWQSFNFLTDTVIPGMRLWWNLTSRVNHNLTAWKSASDPALGDYVAGFDLNGNPQFYIWLGMKMIWRGGPWNGERFIGVEGMKRDSSFGIYYEFVWDATELSFTFSLNPSVVNRLVMNSSGFVGNLLWIEEKKTWRYVGFEPRDECDSISRCGPYSVCHPDGSSLCRCLPGFLPGKLQDGSDGCVRKTALDCSNGTDGFAVQSNVKLPDTTSSTVDWSTSLAHCEDRCLKNCALHSLCTRQH